MLPYNRVLGQLRSTDPAASVDPSDSREQTTRSRRRAARKTIRRYLHDMLRWSMRERKTHGRGPTQKDECELPMRGDRQENRVRLSKARPQFNFGTPLVARTRRLRFGETIIETNVLEIRKHLFIYKIHRRQTELRLQKSSHDLDNRDYRLASGTDYP